MLRIDNNTDSNQLLGANFFGTAIVSKMFVLTIIKNMLYYITLDFI